MALSIPGGGSRPDRTFGWFTGRSTAAAHAPGAPPALRDGPAPRVWTVFAVYLGVLVASYWLVFMADPIGVLASWLEAHLAFFAILVLTQVAIGAAAFIPAWLSREPVCTRLGLVRPGVPAWGYPVLALACFVPWIFGMLLSWALELLGESGGSGPLTRTLLTGELAVPFVLFMTLGPGFMEELLFRGYIQRRLLQRWSPPVAILVTSFLFGVGHLDLGQGAQAFVGGLWLGVLAWRTGSVWPGILCHAVINGTSGAAKLVNLASSTGDPTSDVVRILLGVILFGLLALALASFPVAVWLITRRREAAPRASARPEPVAA